MAQKLFKIGEYAAHGKWKVVVSPAGSVVTLIGIDYQTDKEVERKEFTNPSHNDLADFLNEVMSSYWTDKLIEYVESIATLKQPTFTMFSNL
jgi:hypothetical protein